jgi:hypothetical protein
MGEFFVVLFCWVGLGCVWRRDGRVRISVVVVVVVVDDDGFTLFTCSISWDDG